VCGEPYAKWVPVRLMIVVATVVFAIVLAVVWVQRWGEDDRQETASQVGFSPPEAIPVNSEYVQSQILPSGDLRVEHWIRSTRGIYELTLSLPPTTPRNDQAEVKARALRVEDDGQTHVGPPDVGAREDSYFFPRASTLHVSYILSGVVVRSSSVAGRALLQVTSVDLGITGNSLPKTLVVTGGDVLAAACTTPDRNTAPRPCGNPDKNGWRVRLSASARDDRVMAQLDLP